MFLSSLISKVVSVTLLCAISGFSPVFAIKPRLKVEVTSNIVRGSLGSKLDNYLSEAEALGYSGIVLVVKNGQIVLQRGYGFADRNLSIPLTPNTRFPLASVDKTFTAAAILKLEEQGKLRTTDTITNYFARVPEDKKGITIHHLLTHSAGLPDYSGSDEELISRDTLVERMLNIKLRSEPGARYSYSNPSYSLLAVIVEKVSRRPFEAFVQEQLFRPAGMSRTNYNVTKQDQEQLPCGYWSWDPDCRPTNYVPGLPDGPSWNVRGNSGRWSTAADLYRWHVALNKGTVLSKESNRKATTAHVKTPGSGQSGYGYGWFITTTDRKTRLVHHSGGDQVVAANFRRFVDEDVAIIEFTNNAWGPYRRVRDEVSRIVFGGQPPDLPTARLKLPQSFLRRLAGTYELTSGAKFKVVIKNGQLIVPTAEPGAAKSFTRFPILDGVEATPDIEARTSRVINGLARGDMGPLQESIWRELKFDEESQFWNDTWVKWVKKHGELKGVEVIGTRAGSNSLVPGVSLVDAYVQIRFERGAELVNFQQNPEGRFFINYSATNLLPAYYQLVPLSKAEFATYNFLLQTVTRVRFKTDGSGAVMGVVIEDGKGDVVAKRMLQ